MSTLAIIFLARSHEWFFISPSTSLIVACERMCFDLFVWDLCLSWRSLSSSIAFLTSFAVAVYRRAIFFSLVFLYLAAVVSIILHDPAEGEGVMVDETELVAAAAARDKAEGLIE